MFLVNALLLGGPTELKANKVVILGASRPCCGNGLVCARLLVPCETEVGAPISFRS